MSQADLNLVLHTPRWRSLSRAWPLLVLALWLLCALMVGLGYWAEDWQKTGAANLPISPTHPLGSNALGQDLLALSLQALASMASNVIPGAALALGIGVLLGALAGWHFGGWSDQLISLACDVFDGLPAHLLLVGLALIVRTPSAQTLLFAALFWTSAARPVRGLCQRLKPAAFVDAALLLGASPWGLGWRHILPNLRSMILASFLLIFANCIRAQLLLGFIGLDRQARPSLGGLLQDGALSALSFDFTPLLLALALSFVILLALDALNRRFSPAIG